jgi:antitoxin (DNA-binding transcriptional repressor) of toxin-antitoxin stability system
MTQTISTDEIKTYLPEAIELALAEDSLVITRYDKPIAAIVSYEDLMLLQRIKTSLKGQGLADFVTNS